MFFLLFFFYIIQKKQLREWQSSTSSTLAGCSGLDFTGTAAVGLVEVEASGELANCTGFWNADSATGLQEGRELSARVSYRMRCPLHLTGWKDWPLPSGVYNLIYHTQSQCVLGHVNVRRRLARFCKYKLSQFKQICMCVPFVLKVAEWDRIQWVYGHCKKGHNWEWKVALFGIILGKQAKSRPLLGKSKPALSLANL